LQKLAFFCLFSHNEKYVAVIWTGFC